MQHAKQHNLITHQHALPIMGESTISRCKRSAYEYNTCTNTPVLQPHPVPPEVALNRMRA